MTVVLFRELLSFPSILSDELGGTTTKTKTKD
jgi:hypothetical protein